MIKLSIQLGVCLLCIAQSISANDLSLPMDATLKRYVFVSLSMPSASLKTLLIDSKQWGASVVLRGLKNNSVKETLSALQGFIQETGMGFIVNPELFDKYQIAHVPSFVLVTNTKFDKVSGNIRLDTAFDIVQRHGELQTLAQKSNKGLV